MDAKDQDRLSAGPTCPARGRARATSVIVVLCLVYLFLELLYVTRTDFNPDELQGARTVYQLQTQVPYRDFKPYKTVLGYYVQYPVMRLCQDPWTCLTLLRGELALVNAAALLAATLVLARRFRPEAACLGLALIVTMSTFLERSYEIRSDMLAAWCGLASLLALMDRRLIVSGLICALSFFFSQKGAYYVIASEVALLGWWVAQRNRSAIGNAIVFNGVMLAVFVGYIGFWTAMASWPAVRDALFFSHHKIAFGNQYEDLRLTYWLQTIGRNPFFYLIGGLSAAQLGWWTWRRSAFSAGDSDRILVLYSSALAGLCIWHKQPWPYFFVMLIPTVFVLHVRFFHHWLDRIAMWRRGARVTVAAVFVLALLFPLYRLETMWFRSNGYQQHMMELADAFLEPGESYIDGVDLIYHHRQAIRELRWLDRDQIAGLNAMPGDRLQQLQRRLELAPVKLIFNNWRMDKLPGPVRDYLDTQYTPLVGAICIYSPTLPADQTQFNLKFSGTYQIDGLAGQTLHIDQVACGDDQEIELAAGSHQLVSDAALRLTLLPENWRSMADPRYIDPRHHFMQFGYSR